MTDRRPGLVCAHGYGALNERRLRESASRLTLRSLALHSMALGSSYQRLSNFALASIHRKACVSEERTAKRARAGRAPFRRTNAVSA